MIEGEQVLLVTEYVRSFLRLAGDWRREEWKGAVADIW